MSYSFNQIVYAAQQLWQWDKWFRYAGYLAVCAIGLMAVVPMVFPTKEETAPPVAFTPAETAPQPQSVFSSPPAMQPPAAVTPAQSAPPAAVGLRPSLTEEQGKELKAGWKVLVYERPGDLYTFPPEPVGGFIAAESEMTLAAHLRYGVRYSEEPAYRFTGYIWVPEAGRYQVAIQTKPHEIMQCAARWIVEGTATISVLPAYINRQETKTWTGAFVASAPGYYEASAWIACKANQVSDLAATQISILGKPPGDMNLAGFRSGAVKYR